MIEAKWRRYETWKRERDIYVGRTGGTELARAWCGRDCGDWVAHSWFESVSVDEKHPDSFRIRPGFVQRDASDLAYPFWELSMRAQKQRRSALFEGKSLAHWQPKPRGRLEYDEYLRGTNSAMDRLIGVVSQHGFLKGGIAWYTVDPHATGGTVVVRCPNCTWRNEVHPCPPLKGS